MAYSLTSRPLCFLILTSPVAVQAEGPRAGGPGRERPAPQEVVAVLGVESFEWDDAFAQQLTAALEQAAAQTPLWKVSPHKVTFSQLAVEHDCTDERDVMCLGRIAEAL